MVAAVRDVSLSTTTSAGEFRIPSGVPAPGARPSNDRRATLYRNKGRDMLVLDVSQLHLLRGTAIRRRGRFPGVTEVVSLDLLCAIHARISARSHATRRGDSLTGEGKRLAATRRASCARDSDVIVHTSCFRKSRSRRLIPTFADHHAWAQSRKPMDMIFHG